MVEGGAKKNRLVSGMEGAGKANKALLSSSDSIGSVDSAKITSLKTHTYEIYIIK